MLSITSPLRQILTAGLLGLALSGSPVLAQDYDWAADFPTGSALPAIDALDQDGNRRSFEDLSGDNGLLFMLSRSFDW